MIEADRREEMIDRMATFTTALQLAGMRVLMTAQTGTAERRIADRRAGPGRKPRLFRPMTVGAVDLQVGAFERKVRAAIVREAQRRGSEAESGMTGCAPISQLSEVYVSMTTVTSQAQRPESREADFVAVDPACFRGMAAGTGQIEMFARQMETSFPVIEGGLLEPLHGMTGRTVLAELSLMGILRVTGPTFGKGHPFEALAGVAAFASDSSVFPLEWKDRSLAMEPTPGASNLPVDSAVALFAAGPKRWAVPIGVAIGAVGERDSLPAALGVTLDTADVSMGSAKVECGLIVIEQNLAELPRDVVATSAIGSEPPLMDIPMAG